MKKVGTITKGLLSTIGRIIKFSVLLVIAIIASLIIIANLEGISEGIGLIITWVLFTFSNRSKKPKKEKETDEE